MLDHGNDSIFDFFTGNIHIAQWRERNVVYIGSLAGQGLDLLNNFRGENDKDDLARDDPGGQARRSLKKRFLQFTPPFAIRCSFGIIFSKFKASP